jgi:hypothetical protein
MPGHVPPSLPLSIGSNNHGRGTELLMQLGGNRRRCRLCTCSHGRERRELYALHHQVTDVATPCTSTCLCR